MRCWIAFTLMFITPSLLAADDNEVPVRVLRGHTKQVHSLAFAPGGKTLVSGGDDATIRLWDTESGKEKTTLKTGGAAIWAVTFSNDGKTLGSGLADKTIILWDVNAGRITRTLKGHDGLIRCLAFSPDGKIIASGSVDETVKLWEVKTGGLLHSLRGSSAISAVVFSPDSQSLAFSSSDKVKVCSVMKGEEQQILKHERWVSTIALSADGKMLASGTDALGIGDGELLVWDMATGKKLNRVLTPMGRGLTVGNIAFLPGKKGLVFVLGRLLGHDREIVVWDLEKNKEHKKLKEPGLTAMTVAPDGKSLSTANSEDSAIRLWDLKPGKE